MTFHFHPFESKNADNDLLDQILVALNTMTDQATNSAKIATSDQHKGDARGVVITCDGVPSGKEKLGKPWACKAFETGSDYIQMYNECILFLNTAALSETQKYHSKITMTNAESNKATLVLWWQTPIG